MLIPRVGNMFQIQGCRESRGVIDEKKKVGVFGVCSHPASHQLFDMTMTLGFGTRETESESMTALVYGNFVPYDKPTALFSYVVDKSLICCFKSRRDG